MKVMNSTKLSNGLTLVLGGTGKTGRRVVERLASRDVPMRVASRAGDPSFDWGDQSTWDAVAYVCDGVQLALGRKPTDFAEYARRIADSGVWDVSSSHQTAVA